MSLYKYLSYQQVSMKPHMWPLPVVKIFGFLVQVHSLVGMNGCPRPHCPFISHPPWFMTHSSREGQRDTEHRAPGSSYRLTETAWMGWARINTPVLAVRHTVISIVSKSRRLWSLKAGIEDERIPGHQILKISRI